EGVTEMIAEAFRRDPGVKGRDLVQFGVDLIYRRAGVCIPGDAACQGMLVRFDDASLLAQLPYAVAEQVRVDPLRPRAGVRNLLLEGLLAGDGLGLEHVRQSRHPEHDTLKRLLVLGLSL